MLSISILGTIVSPFIYHILARMIQSSPRLISATCIYQIQLIQPRVVGGSAYGRGKLVRYLSRLRRILESVMRSMLEMGVGVFELCCVSSSLCLRMRAGLEEKKHRVRIHLLLKGWALMQSFDGDDVLSGHVRPSYCTVYAHNQIHGCLR